MLSKIKGWKGELLKPAGKEVIAKSVLLVLPTCAMACVKIPFGMFKMLNSNIAQSFGVELRTQGKFTVFRVNALNEFDEFDQVQLKEAVEPKNQAIIQSNQRSPPAQGILKIKVDGSLQFYNW